MRSMIYRKHRIDQLVLCFDSLIPEEVKKLLDCIWDDSMNDILNDYIEVEYSYNVNKVNDRWVHDSVIFIRTPGVDGIAMDEVDEELEKDRKILKRIRDILLKKSGLVEEED